MSTILAFILGAWTGILLIALLKANDDCVSAEEWRERYIEYLTKYQDLLVKAGDIERELALLKEKVKKHDSTN
jgi:hypothetical protein